MKNLGIGLSLCWLAGLTACVATEPVVPTPTPAQAAAANPPIGTSQPLPTATRVVTVPTATRVPLASATLERLESGTPTASSEPPPVPTLHAPYEYILQVLISADGTLRWTRVCQMGALDWYSNRVCQDTRLPNGQYHPVDFSQPVELTPTEVGTGDGQYGSLSMFAYINSAGKQFVSELILNLAGTQGWKRVCEVSLTDGAWTCPQMAEGRSVWDDANLGGMLAEVGETGFGAVGTHVQPAELGGRLRQTFVSQDGLRFYTRLCAMGADGPILELCDQWVKGDLPIHHNTRTGRSHQAVGAFSDFYYTINDPGYPAYNGLYLRQSFVGYDQLYGWTHACKVSDLPANEDAWSACVNRSGSDDWRDRSVWTYTINSDLKLFLPDSNNKNVPAVTGYGCLIFRMTQPLFEVPTAHR